ncbi:hypothetical protein ZIOFF_029740 [Zingiber officinale]|uniref:Reverse transcriptase Ty1/copia-type domain-containing protein n=1 Tax=Zingiber officinale TaxID=94328 RepID=A0A8J5LG98_ZINOF|nr:hypothetical protein ZIOFF_029740 [Zingiber officinale]
MWRAWLQLGPQLQLGVGGIGMERVGDVGVGGSNPSMFGEFKEAMTKEFEMTDIGLMAYYLGIEVNQREDGSFISQAGYAREILKKFRMDNSKSINTPIECGVKLSKHDEEEKVDPTFFKSLVGSLRYLTCTRPDILYAVGLVSRYMEDPTTTHLKIAKRILRYIKDDARELKEREPPVTLCVTCGKGQRAIVYLLSNGIAVDIICWSRS